MTRIRLTLEDDKGRELTSEKEHIYDLPGGMQQLVDIEAAVEHFKQQVLPDLEVELLRRAQQQFMAEVKKGAS